ncbi:MAG TPA: large conductance mechanosensitive channel protein MscL [Mobilitalea sp.]|nr:large conductance mechanosensitive channel protein MscL [Mobilitalea sp.]
MLKEFKKFALKGNMIDLAVGIIIGSAFTGIVNSLVNDVIMPLLSVFTKNIDFSTLFFTLDGKSYESLAAAEEAEVAIVKYGNFISGVLTFIIMAFVVFLIVKGINKLKKPEVVAAPTTKKCPHCLSDINIQASRCPQCTSEV